MCSQNPPTVSHHHPHVHLLSRPSSTSASPESIDPAASTTRTPSSICVNGKSPEAVEVRPLLARRTPTAESNLMEDHNRGQHPTADAGSKFFSIFSLSKTSTKDEDPAKAPASTKEELQLYRRRSETPTPCLHPPPQPTFLTLPPEIHLMIASYLPASSFSILHEISAIAPFYPEPHSVTSSKQKWILQELMTRDRFEETVRPHILKWGRIRCSKLTPEQVDVLQVTRVYCSRCRGCFGLRHFTCSEIVYSMQFEGEDKYLHRLCNGAMKTIKWGKGPDEEITWHALEVAMYELVRASHGAASVFENSVAATVAAQALVSRPPIHQAAPAPQPGVWTAPDALGNRLSPGSRKVSANMHIIMDLTPRRPTPTPTTTTTPTPYAPYTDDSLYFPEKYVRLHKMPSAVEHRGYRFEAHTQNYTLLVKNKRWSSKLETNMRRLRLALILKNPVFCPHMDFVDLVLDQDAQSCINTSLLKYLVTALHSKDLPWEEGLVEGSEVVKYMKSMEAECSCVDRGCRTEVVLERARCMVVRKGVLFKGGHAKKGEEKVRWQEYVWVRVTRKWAVDTPRDVQWGRQACKDPRKKTWGGIQWDAGN